MGILPRIALGLPLVLMAGYGIFECSKQVQAEVLARRDTVPALESALRLTPGNAEYHARIAVLDATRNDELETALRLNPWAQSWWIMRSVHQEEEDDLPGAEQSLKRANLVGQYYMPRWSLAAFYYRQGRREEFLEWGRKAQSVGYGSPDSLFRMAQRLGFSSTEILDRLIPDVPDKIGAYLDLVERDGDESAVYQSAVKLLQIGAKVSRDRVLDACDHLYTSGRIDEAVGLWNESVQAKWIGLRTLDVSRGRSLAEEGFATPSLLRGFDWHFTAVPGVFASTSDADSSLRLEFSGDEPESCEFVAQYAPLAAGRKYKLAARYRLEGIAPETGLQWRVQSVDGKQTLLTGLLNQPANDFVEQAFEFKTGGEELPAMIVLRYTRQPGTTRIEGKLWMQSVTLELVP
jgi:hypothetical protein